MEPFETIRSGCEADHDQPLQTFCEIAPLAKLCEKAYADHQKGVERAKELTYWLMQCRPFRTLWCSEKEYDAKELEEQFKKIAAIEPLASSDLQLPVSFFNTLHWKSCFTLVGHGTSLGFFKKGEIEVRAMGPQDESLHFGIEGKGERGWVNVFCDFEVWLKAAASLVDNRWQLQLNFAGLKCEKILYFSLYVKAKTCQIEGQTFYPGNLCHFSKTTNLIQFENCLKIETPVPRKTKVIPLAGKGSFWDCDFLINYELSFASPNFQVFIY